MRKLFLFALLTLSAGLWAANSVITFTSTGKLYPVDIDELREDVMMGDGAKWAAFKAQYPEFKDVNSPTQLKKMGISINPNAFLDANNQVLTFTIDYDESTHAGMITVNGKLVKIADEAFDDCTALTSITLPEGVTSIESSAFSGTALTSITLPEGVTSIESSAFSSCTALTSVILPESLSSIGTDGFYKCPLSSVTIPANVTYLGASAFGENSSLADVYVAWTTTLPTLGANATFRDSPIDKVTLHVLAGSKALYQDADVWKDFGSIVEYDVLQEAKDAAITEITTAREGIQNENLNNWIDGAINDIQKGGPDATPGIDEIKEEVLNLINFFKEGKAEGLAEAAAALPTDPEGTTGHTVTITKGDKTLILVNPDKVTYGKQE